MRIISFMTVLLVLGAGCSGEITSDGGDDPAHDPPVHATAHSAIGLPDPGTLSSPEEGYAIYDENIDLVSACNNGEVRSGMGEVATYLAQFGIVAENYASCQTGFHPRGQALDVYVSGFDGKQAFADWLTANDNEMARRLGIVQIVWNYHMWRSYDGGSGKPQGAFGNYGGSNPHTDHVHLSFGEAAAEGATSFFTEVINGGGGGGGGGGGDTQSTFTQCGWLNIGEVIGTDKPLPSCGGGYFLAQQTDGNLVLYRSDGTALWSTSTSGSAARMAAMQTDGNFVLYTTGGQPVWDTATSGNDGASLAVQDDGNLVLYLGGTPIWASGTAE
jgi:hypothetical protein